MESTRQQKVARLVQRELADFFLRNGREFSGGGLVSVTQVRISPDLSIARIYLSIMGGHAAPETMGHVEAAKGRIRYEIGHALGKSLRIVPDFHFFHDDSAAYADRIDRLLKQSRSSEKENGSADA